MSDTVEINTRGLTNLIKALKGDQPKARVGVLGSKTNRSSKAGGKTNAEVGLAHEYGTADLPIRSFLRVPLAEKLQSYLDSSGAFDTAAAGEILRTGSLTTWLRKIATIAETVVLDAFATGGFGKWEPSNMSRKKNAQTLVETQQLRNSISFEVKES